MVAKLRWGDTLDDEDTGIPPSRVLGPDANGVKTVIEYKKNEKGEIIKVSTKTQTSTVTRKVYQAAQERRQWQRFGAAVNEQKGDSVTMQTPEDIPFERVRQRQTQEEKKAQDLKDALAQPDKAAASQSIKDLLYKRRMERQLMLARGLIDQPEKPPGEDDGMPGSGTLPAAGAKGGYVPPSLRNRLPGEAGESMRPQRREENSVRVTNLSEDTREEDLRELFSVFGAISRIYVAYDRERGGNRGFAFVNFVRRDDAQKAIDKLDGYGYDNLILHVEWAQPRTERG